MGALELLSEDVGISTIFPNITEVKFIDSRGEREETYDVAVRAKSQDLVIMNPPYTRAMSDWLKDAEGTWKPFNALGNTSETQREMREREKSLAKNTRCYNGYQSMPSAFCGVAHKMLKENGIFAFVLPITALQGVSWVNFREMLSLEYSEVKVVSIAGETASASNWSADTHLAEVLVIAKKSAPSLRASVSDYFQRGIAINLNRQPVNDMIAAEFAVQIERVVRSSRLRTLEDGPFGGTPLLVGGEHSGEILSVPLTADADAWQCLGIQNLSLVQFVYQLSSGILWFPRDSKPHSKKLPIRAIGDFANVGFAANNIANNTRSAFQRIEIGTAPTYPMLWRNSSKLQRQMILQPDLEGRVRPGKEEHASRIWDRRSKAVIAAEVSFQNQSLVAGFSQDSCIGGRAWPNIQLSSELQEKAFVLWGNTSIGALSYWIHCSRQQVVRGIVTVRSIGKIPWFDPTSLSDSKLQQANQIFEDFKLREFLPVAQCDQDPNRKELDKVVITELLGLPDECMTGFELVRQKWCQEPSISGQVA